MAFPLSPAVQITEQNLSQFVVTTSNTTVAIVGYATNGPLNTPTLINSKAAFQNTFGNPSTLAPWGAMAALRSLNQTSSLLYYRVANTTQGDSTAQAQFAERVSMSVGHSDSALGYRGGADSNKIQIIAKNPGSGYNTSYVTLTQRTNPVTGDSMWDWRFFSNGVLQETYNGVTWRVGDSHYFATIIGATPQNGGSNWIAINTRAYGKYPTYIRLAPLSVSGTVSQFNLGASNGAGDTRYRIYARGDSYGAKPGTLGYYTFAYGRDGILGGTTGFTGDTLFANALSTTGALANQELWNYHIIMAPDNGDNSVANALVSLVENRTDALAIIDPPQAVSVATVVAWHNGLGNGRTSALNSSYSATWWPWLMDYNQISGQYIWVPPSVFLGEKLCYVDNNFGPWYAPAGDIRGLLAAYNYEQSPGTSDRDNLYGGLNAINPIVNFASRGLEIYGQKTLSRTTSAINRINVRRMIIYIKKLIKNAVDQLVFEPNNADSWARCRTIINAILEPVRQANGLADYKVIIDSTTTTPSLIQQSIMAGTIQIVPVGTIEIISLTLQINPTGSSIQ